MIITILTLKRLHLTLFLIFSVTCDFESENICGYIQETKSNYNWTKQKGHTPSTGTGPATDHTYGTMSGK